mmetsp:Transcript_43639/g.107977  ORF Transcript_43639/g.107977 Transcript_43639/m.107977 type:complete len:249 (-) Transcript_43639:2420-3166(-)
MHARGSTGRQMGCAAELSPGGILHARTRTQGARSLGGRRDPPHLPAVAHVCAFVRAADRSAAGVRQVDARAAVGSAGQSPLAAGAAARQREKLLRAARGRGAQATRPPPPPRSFRRRRPPRDQPRQRGRDRAAAAALHGPRDVRVPAVVVPAVLLPRTRAGAAELRFARLERALRVQPGRLGDQRQTGAPLPRCHQRAREGLRGAGDVARQRGGGACGVGIAGCSCRREGRNSRGAARSRRGERERGR